MLAKRVVSAVIAILCLIFVMYVGGWFLRSCALILALLGMNELYHAFTVRGYKPVYYLGYLFIAIFFIYIFLLKNDNGIFLFLVFSVLGLSVPVFNSKVTIIDISITIMGMIYPGLIFVLLVIMAEETKVNNYYIFTLTLATTFSTDIFAYFIGSRFGKKKLCPSISPNKTIEGSTGGLIGSLLIGLLTGLVYNYYYNMDLSLIHYIIIGVLCGVFSQIGDLAASSIKRFCGIKDFGKLMPGHGGILDRIDSLLLSAPIVYIYFILFIKDILL